MMQERAITVAAPMLVNHQTFQVRIGQSYLKMLLLPLHMTLKMNSPYQKHSLEKWFNRF
jgi:hypothetical protein